MRDGKIKVLVSLTFIPDSQCKCRAVVRYTVIWYLRLGRIVMATWVMSVLILSKCQWPLLIYTVTLSYTCGFKGLTLCVCVPVYNGPFTFPYLTSTPCGDRVGYYLV